MKHTAVTIGPILKSLGLAHKTRELWAASYFFSYFMEEVIKNLNNDDAIILPFPNKKGLIKELQIDSTKIKSAGVFPDRLILSSENGLFAELEKAVYDTIKTVKSKFNFNCNETELKNYISAHIIEFDYTERASVTDDNIIYQTNDFLATCELQTNYTAEDKENFLNMLEHIDKANLYKSIFKKGFPSLIEICTQGLNTNGINFSDDTDDDNEIWKTLKEQNGNELKINKKYIAIVQADGDNIGNIIKQEAKKGNASIKEFSKALSTFSLLASEAISSYNGVPIYTGGDDLLFFAPVTNKTKNIFTLIEELDAIFKEKVSKKFKIDKATMSYGVSISYYKFPMQEALNTVLSLLFGKAKSGAKNAIAFKIQKHSGQSFEATLRKPLSKSFKNLIDKDKGLVLNSILYQFEKRKTLLKEALNPNSKAQLAEFFNNFYNEDIHKKNQNFIIEIKDYLEEVYAKNKNDFEITIQQVNAQLRLIKFLNATKDD